MKPTKSQVLKIIEESLVEQIDSDAEKEEMIEEYMSGDCIHFALALKHLFPEYNIAVLKDISFEDDNYNMFYDINENDDDDDDDDDDLEINFDDEEGEYNYNFVHMFCYKDNDPNTIVDARGVRRLKDLYDEFYDIDPEVIYDVPNSKVALINAYAGVEFASEETYEWNENTYKGAIEFINDFKNEYTL